MRLLEDSLAEKVLGEEIKAGDTVVVDVGGERFPILYIQTPDRPSQRLLLVASLS